MGREVKRGDIYWVDFNPVIGCEQHGLRPCLVVSNNIGNCHAPTVIVAAITSRKKSHLPTHCHLGSVWGISHDSQVLLEQIRTIDKGRLVRYITSIDKKKMEEIDEAILVSLDLIESKPVYFGGKL